METFIQLTKLDGKEININVFQITAFTGTPLNMTTIFFQGEDSVSVKESPEEVKIKLEEKGR